MGACLNPKAEEAQHPLAWDKKRDARFDISFCDNLNVICKSYSVYHSLIILYAVYPINPDLSRCFFIGVFIVIYCRHGIYPFRHVRTMDMSLTLLNSFNSL